VVFKGGLPGYRLKRVLDYIEASLEENISLSQRESMERIASRSIGTNVPNGTRFIA
jgi:hypothetical protein